jgi:phage terminase large subunit GpA-like protein
MLPDTQIRLKTNAKAVYAAAAKAIAPDPRIRVSEWAERHRVVPDMGSLPGRWRNETSPELVEIMDSMSPDDPTEHGIVMKPAQSGGSAVGENFLGFVMTSAPGPAMYVAPTVAAAWDWKVEKLDPTIEATPGLNPATGGVVAPQRSRNGEGSTRDRLKFRGGFLKFSGANSAASLRQHSIRYMIRDDVAGWTDNADGEGNPLALSDARLKTYRVFGLSKKLDISTPKFKGDSFDLIFQASDQRRFYVACLECGDLTDYEWSDVKKNAAAPYRCHVLCPSCGHVHYDHHKRAMKALGVWIPTAPDADGIVPPKTIAAVDVAGWVSRETGRTVRGWAMTGLLNTFEKWDLIAKAEADAGNDPLLRQPFENTVLGQPYEPRGEGPAWETLAARKSSEWQRGEVPAGAIVLILTADVQADGIYWELTGWASHKENWLVDYGYLAGPTDAANEGAWPKLDAVVERGAKAGKVQIAPHVIGVDSGYNAEAVYGWTKRHHNALALKGEDGWSKPPIYRARATEIEVVGRNAGKPKAGSPKVWHVGTYGLKGAHYVYLTRSEGSGVYHFPGNTEEAYFRQLVSEYVRVEMKGGVPVRTWERTGPNHWLDCRIYAWALTHYAGLWNWTEDRWQRAAEELAEFVARSENPQRLPIANAAPPVPHEPRRRDTFIPTVPKDWFSR